MIIIKPIEDTKVIRISIFGITLTISRKSSYQEKREHAEEAYYLAVFLAGQEQREYGIYLPDDPVPILVVSPLAMKEGAYVDHAICN